MSRSGSFDMGTSVVRALSDAMPDWLAALVLGQPMARAMTFGQVSDVKPMRRGLVAPVAWLKAGANTQKSNGNRCVDVHLPQSQLLKRTVRLPRTPRRMVERAVTLDMLRRTPFKPDQTYSVLTDIQTSRDSTTLTQWIARRDDIEALRDRLGVAGFRMRRVRIADITASDLADFSGDIYPVGRWWRRLNAFSVVVALAAGVWIWVEPALKAREALRAQEAELQRLTTEALTLRERMQAQTAEESERTAFLSRMTRRTPVSSTLRAATVLMPDEVWLTDMAIDRARVTLRGSTSGSAAQMLLDLPRNRLLRNPQLAGPVAQTNDGRERFDIVFETPQAQP